MGSIRIGTSGWRYAGWRGDFYPRGLVQARELEHISRVMQTVEINGSHYSLQTPKSYRAWHDATPGGFVFSVKGSRYITHMLALDSVTRTVATANFFASGLLLLGAKLGPILWQFPPRRRFDPEAMDRFLGDLPRDTVAAAKLAERHDQRVAEPVTETDRKRRMRHAIEIRHPSYCDESFVRMLRRHGVALVVSDAVADWPKVADVTADFVYLRLHGAETLYGGSYSDESLDGWASRIAVWAAGREPADVQRISSRLAARRGSRDVYCYFDNDQKVRAPYDAMRLMQRLAR
jgi:uncharacterized protein YecE (DUF72 family)